MRRKRRELKVTMMICLLAACAAPNAACRRAAANATAAEVAKARDVTLPTVVTAGGVVRPQVGAEVRVGPRISGVLRRLYARVGDTVRKGQVLAELEDRELRARLKQEDAALARDVADRDLQRVRCGNRGRLAASGVIGAEEAATSRAELARAEAQVAYQRAVVDEAGIQLGYATIRAPIAGTVTAVATQEGETVASSFAVPTFVTIVDLDRTEVSASIDEVDVARVAVGQSCVVTADALSGAEFSGRVAAITPQATTKNGIVSFAALIELVGKRPAGLRPEMSVSVMIDVGREERTVVVPANAVVRDAQGATFVYVVEQDGKKKRTVTVGEESNGLMRIRSGVRAGEDVVISPSGARAE